MMGTLVDKSTHKNALLEMIITYFDSQLNLVPFLHFFTQFSFIFLCEYKLELRKFTRYIISTR